MPSEDNIKNRTFGYSQNLKNLNCGHISEFYRFNKLTDSMNRAYQPNSLPHFNNYKNHSLLYQMTNTQTSAKAQQTPTKPKKVQRPSVSTICSNNENSINSGSFETAESNIESTSNGCALSSRQLPQLTKYKTEMCKNLQSTGFCKYGDNCYFAHCKTELQARVPYNQHYKTKICKHYNKTGFCPYASRCQYFHVKSEQLYLELLDSFEKKVALRLTAERVELKSVLQSTERVQKRLEVFKRLADGSDCLSFQEKCLENQI